MWKTQQSHIRFLQNCSLIFPVYFAHSILSSWRKANTIHPSGQTRDCSLASDIETLVVLQVPQVGKTLSTLVAHELLLPGVYLLVGFQAVALVETASACIAAERLLPGVDTLVSVQIARVAETFPARVAAEGLLSCVDHL